MERDSILPHRRRNPALWSAPRPPRAWARGHESA